jgi:hypothetical protein
MKNINTIKYLFLFFSFLIPTFFYTSYVLNQVYNSGATLLDVGWFTYLISSGYNWPLTNPEVLHNTHLGKTFFYTHFSPFFIFFSFLYENFFYFLSPSFYFALFVGSMHALISFSIFLFSINVLKSININRLILILIISILTSFNGQSLAMIGFPHIEIAIPSLIILFLVFFYIKNTFLAIFVFIVLLTIREDAGFHLFSLIFIMSLFLCIQEKSLKVIDKKLVTYALVAFCYSVITILIQKLYFAGTDNALERIYLGTPIFAHITYDLIVQRLNFLFENREYLYLPLFFTFLISFLTRNIVFLTSFFATLPWIILSFFAVNSMHSSFSNYCIFPFIIIICWPLLSFLILSKKNMIYFSQKFYFFIFFFTILISIIGFPNNKGNEDAKPWNNFIFTDFKEIVATQSFIQNFKTYNKSFGNIVVDEASSVLLTKYLKPNSYVYLNNFSKEQKNNTDTFIFFKNTNNIETMLVDNYFKYYYKVLDTNIIIASKYKFNFNGIAKIDYRVLDTISTNIVIKHNSKKIYFEGWSNSEEKYRWSLNDSSSILFILDSKDEIKGDLELSVMTLGEQKIEILLNQTQIGKFEIDSRDFDIKLSFDKKLIKTNEVNEIKFIYSNPHQPNEDDSRILAMALKFMIIR